MGISRITLVGRSDRKESDIFEMTFSIRFCLSSKVLNGGLMKIFFPLRSCLKSHVLHQMLDLLDILSAILVGDMSDVIHPYLLPLERNAFGVFQ